MSAKTSAVFPDPTRTLIPIVKPYLSQVWRQLECCSEAALSKKDKASLIGGIGIMRSFGSSRSRSRSRSRSSRSRSRSRRINSTTTTTIWTHEWTVRFALVLIVGQNALVLIVGQNQTLFLSTTSALRSSNSGRSSSPNCTQSKCCRGLCHTLLEFFQ